MNIKTMMGISPYFLSTLPTTMMGISPYFLSTLSRRGSNLGEQRVK